MKNIFGVNVFNGQYWQCQDFILSLRNKAVSSYVCFANAHMIVEANRSDSFRSVLENADAVFMDGMSLVLSNRILNNDKFSERFAGMDVIRDILNRCEEDSFKVFFYGSTSENLAELKRYLKDNFPNLGVAGSYSPPFRPLTPLEKVEHSEMINLCKPDFVFVSLGCPKQEIWMSEMKGKVNSVMLGVGNAILTLSQQEKRAPIVMQRMGMEWLFRFLIEPRRLFKRYLHTNSYFIFLFLKKLLRYNRKIN